METSIYEDRAKQIINEIKELIEAKGIDIDSNPDSTIISGKAQDFFSGKTIPSLIEFLALCEISGITISSPSIETPDNPM